MIGYHDREKIKIRAWSLVRNKRMSMYVRAQGLLMVADMHYMRVLKDLLDSSVQCRKKYIDAVLGYEADLIPRSVYQSNWIAAQMFRAEFSEIRDVFDYVVNVLKYEPVEHRMMPIGMTCYGSIYGFCHE